MDHPEVTQRVRTLHPDATIEIAGEACSFELSVTTPAFEGQNSLQRQKPILALFREEIRSGEIHALSINAMTPEEKEAKSTLVRITR